MTRLRLLDLTADRMEGEAVAAFFFQDERPLCGPVALLDWRLNGLLTDLLVRGEVSGRVGENILVSNNGKLKAPWILFSGAGRWAGMVEARYRDQVRRLLITSRNAGFGRIALCLSMLPGQGPAATEQMVGEVIREIGEQGPECLLSLEDRESPGRLRMDRR